jgi:hypothetical protein
MPQVLTENATILCPHMGKGTSVSSTRVWSVNSGFVLVEGDTGVLACPFLPLPCAGYTLRSMGLNATVIQGRKVVLATDFNQTLTGLPLTIFETHPVIDNSTPAPLPAGAASQPLAPELLDTANPVVTAVTPALAFSNSAPAPLNASFKLSSTFPMSWVLTLIKTVVPGNLDLTNGAPGAVVTPSGGSWSTPSLSVSVAMTQAFLAALGIGKHSLYMTGINKRGLNAYAECSITVSA